MTTVEIRERIGREIATGINPSEKEECAWPDRTI